MLRTITLLTLLLVGSCSFLRAQSIPTPKEHFGFAIGDNYNLATYTQTEAYFKKLAVSDRVKLTDIGLTEEGRHQYMLIVTSPENHKKLERYKEISVKLARAEGITEDQAKAMAAEGKAIVWIDGGLHATETVGIHQLIETLYHVVSRTDAETMRILDKTIILFTHANPDGQELVSNWYMRDPKPENRKLDHLPRLYQKYIGHDNNRDFFIMNMKETQNMGRQLFVEWIPQIMYNHHQAGPAGSVLAGPPYRDPFNYVFDPMMITGIDAVGASMINRLNAENKPGYTRLGGSVFSTWYNGGLRTTTHFHNMIGLLTEIVGGPTPSEIPVVPSRLVPNNNTPYPVTPQKWYFKQSIDYSVSLNYAVLDYASRHSDQLLYNIYKMGRNSIERGSADYWTPYPAKVEAITTAFKNRPRKTESAGPDVFGLTGPGIPVKYYDSIFKVPAKRDPRGFVIPSDQADFPTAVKFVNALIKTGIRVEKAKTEFTVNKKKYAAGSYIVKTNQAFRPHVIDMFEPQDHPNDFQYPGGPPVRPYDAAGWTLAFQMGVKFDRFLENFDGPFEQVPYGELQSPKGSMDASASTAGYLINAKTNNAFLAVNDLLKEGAEVYRLPEGVAGKNNLPAGSFYVAGGAKAKAVLDKSASDYGVTVVSASKAPTEPIAKVTKPRIALWDAYGGSMPSGWVRWLMEQYHFDADIIYSKGIDAGDLRKKYDVIIFVTRAIPGVAKETNDEYGFARRDPKEEEIPAEFRSTMGRITAEKSIPQLKKFMEEGGRIVTIGTSTNLAYHLGLPVKNALTEIGPNSAERNLSNEKYYVPGSILQMKLDSTQSATWGLSNVTDVYFENSPVFKLAPEAVIQGKVKPLAWFGEENPLRSGWAWGATYLKGGVVAFEAPVGKGKLYAFSPEITFRAQAQGTFKLLFNELINVEEVPKKVKLDPKK